MGAMVWVMNAAHNCRCTLLLRLQPLQTLAAADLQNLGEILGGYWLAGHRGCPPKLLQDDATTNGVQRLCCAAVIPSTQPATGKR